MRASGGAFKIQPSGFELHSLPRQPSGSVSLAWHDCTHPPAAWRCEGLAVSIATAVPLCVPVPLLRSTRSHGGDIQCQGVLCRSSGDTVASGCRRVLVYLASALPAWEEEVGAEGMCLCGVGIELGVLVHKAAFHWWGHHCPWWLIGSETRRRTSSGSVPGPQWSSRLVYFLKCVEGTALIFFLPGYLSCASHFPGYFSTFFYICKMSPSLVLFSLMEEAVVSKSC